MILEMKKSYNLIGLNKKPIRSLKSNTLGTNKNSGNCDFKLDILPETYNPTNLPDPRVYSY